MSESFDPYHVWLGIPPHSRPPTHYELLGISPNEREKAVIEAAVLRQSGYVRNFQIGKYGEDAAKVLNEIGAAKGCLLDPVKRARYDAELRAIQPAGTAVDYQVAPPDIFAADAGIDPLAPLSLPLSGDLPSATAAPPPIAKRLPRRTLRGAKLKKPSGISWQPLAGFGIGAALTLVAIALWPRHSADVPRELPSIIGTVSSPPEPLPAAPPSSPKPPALSTADPDITVPKTLKTKTQARFIHNIARCEGDSFFVGMSDWYGEAAVGYELENARRVLLELRVTGELRKQEGNPFAGFVIDYHTAAEYSNRIALSVGPVNGTGSGPHRDIGESAARPTA